MLLGPQAPESLGGALAWARRRPAARLAVVADVAVAGVVARRAAWFADPPTVWADDGGELVAAVAAPVPELAPPPDAPELVATLTAAGLDVVVDDGVLLGELLGLEVARIERGPDGPVLAIGIGRFDRELADMTLAHLDHADRLARVVSLVAEHRRPGAAPHPLNQLQPERWLRTVVVGEPRRVGASSLVPVPGIEARGSLRDVGVAFASGSSVDGRPVLVACSVGVDVDLVPVAADARAALDPSAHLVLAVPARDALPVTVDLAARLADRAEVVVVDDDWRIPWDRRSI